MSKVSNYIKNNNNVDFVEIEGGRINFLISSNQTEDKVGVYESELEPKTQGAPMHLHRIMDEIFYVIEGELSIVVGEEKIVGRSGEVIFVPKGTPHGFSNRGEKRLKILIIFSPALKREGYFRGLAELTKEGVEFSSKKFQELMEKYDQELVEEKDGWLMDFR